MRGELTGTHLERKLAGGESKMLRRETLKEEGNLHMKGKPLRREILTEKGNHLEINPKMRLKNKILPRKLCYRCMRGKRGRAERETSHNTCTRVVARKNDASQGKKLKQEERLSVRKETISRKEIPRGKNHNTGERSYSRGEKTEKDKRNPSQGRSWRLKREKSLDSRGEGSSCGEVDTRL